MGVVVDSLVDVTNKGVTGEVSESVADSMEEVAVVWSTFAVEPEPRVLTDVEVVTSLPGAAVVEKNVVLMLVAVDPAASLVSLAEVAVKERVLRVAVSDVAETVLVLATMSVPVRVVVGAVDVLERVLRVAVSDVAEAVLVLATVSVPVRVVVGVVDDVLSPGVVVVVVVGVKLLEIEVKDSVVIVILLCVAVEKVSEAVVVIERDVIDELVMVHVDVVTGVVQDVCVCVEVESRRPMQMLW
jgi:hypothetical protein